MPNIDNGYFEYSLTGTGENCIVFMNGFRIKFDSWDRVCGKIPGNYSMLLFNRLGVGSSLKATTKQTGSVVVTEIHEFLSKIQIKPPYLLVAHSLGGIYANLYARTFPNDVSGVVFVEAPHPSEIALQRNFKPPVILRAINDGIKRFEKIFDRFKYSEDECIEETVLQVQNSGSFPNVPVTVVSGTKRMPFVPQEAFDTHLRFQVMLLNLSEHSKQWKCNESGHFPQLTEPDVVANAITETAMETRSEQTLQRTSR